MDDLDKLPSFYAGATPRRSASSLDAIFSISRAAHQCRGMAIDPSRCAGEFRAAFRGPWRLRSDWPARDAPLNGNG
jgi:hypothetical protein